MRIEVRDPQGHFDDQTRAYAEYRVFSRLAHLSEDIGRVLVTLALSPESPPDTAGAGRALCTVVIDRAPGTTEVSARGDHPYEAIDLAADLAGRARREQPAP